MDDKQSEVIRLSNAELSVQAIRSIIKPNSNCRSGVIGVNDILNILSYQLYDYELSAVNLPSAISKVCFPNVTAVIAFDIIKDNQFVSNSVLINNLKSNCEIHAVDLIDVMLISADIWISLRQHDRL